jgi:hypothetical protein
MQSRPAPDALSRVGTTSSLRTFVSKRGALTRGLGDCVSAITLLLNSAQERSVPLSPDVLVSFLCWAMRPLTAEREGW